MTRLVLAWRALALVVAAILIFSTRGAIPATAHDTAESGIVCTSVPGSTPTFDLVATHGYVSVPDGNTIYMWSYAPAGGSFQLPGPTLCVEQGDTVTIHLHNDLPEPVSIVFPGQEGVKADGAPSQPVFVAGTLTSLAPAAPVGGDVTYQFVATHAGTYIYESGTDPVKQVQMGLYGALVVRPLDHPEFAYDAQSRFNTTSEAVMLFSEVDPDLHQAVERGQAFDATALHPRYWMINGRSFPDTIAPNNAPWLPTQPYGALLHVEPQYAGNPDPALIRYLNVGALNHPFHPHGNHARVVGRDGRALEGTGGEDLSYEKFLVLVGAGQTWDTLFSWTDVELWSPSNPIPVPIPELQNLTFKDDATWYSGSPYLGQTDELPVGVTSFNECGEFYHVAHSHALNEAANYDAGFGGMLTLIRIDPPGGCPPAP